MFIFAILFAFAFAYSYFKYNLIANNKGAYENEDKEKQYQEYEAKIVYENFPSLENASLEQKIYWESYQRGRKVLFGQMGVELKDKNEKQFDYTSMISKEGISEEDKAKYEEIRSKAYVDGYHKAADSFYCPR